MDRLEAIGATLLHNDAHFWNFLYPVNGAETQCVLFDWPLWRTGLAGMDLAYMIALHLYPEHRRRFEPVLLARYAAVLAEQGIDHDVSGVTEDYRLGILFQLLMPIMEYSWNNPPMVWMPKIEKGFAACEELGCEELLG